MERWERGQYLKISKKKNINNKKLERKKERKKVILAQIWGSVSSYVLITIIWVCGK